METAIFHHDGLRAAKNVLREHTEGCWIRKHIWSRVASPIQILIITIENIANQTLRGFALIIVGTVSFNKKAFKAGVKDLIIMVIQTVVLPYIALASFFSPQYALKTTRNLTPTMQTVSDSYCYLRGSIFTGRVSALVIGLLSIPASIIKSALEIPVQFLRLRPDDALSCILLIVKEPLVNLAITLLSIGPGSARDRVFYSLKGEYLNSPRATKELSTWNFNFIHNQRTAMILW